MTKVQALKNNELLVLKEELKKVRGDYNKKGQFKIRELYLKGKLNVEDLAWMLLIEQDYFCGRQIDRYLVKSVMNMTIKEFIELDEVERIMLVPNDYDFKLSKRRFNKWMRLCK